MVHWNTVLPLPDIGGLRRNKKHNTVGSDELFVLKKKYCEVQFSLVEVVSDGYYGYYERVYTVLWRVLSFLIAVM